MEFAPFQPWQTMVEAEFKKAGLTVHPTNFGFFDLIRFLAPLWPVNFRRKKIEEVYDQLRAAMKGDPNAPHPKISILAHSFGSYIVAEILADRPDIDVHRLAFCGSIVPYNHRFIRQLGTRIRTQSCQRYWDQGFLASAGEQRHDGLRRHWNTRI